MNHFLVAFMGLLVLEASLCTMQKYLYASNLGKYKFKIGIYCKHLIMMS